MAARSIDMEANACGGSFQLCVSASLGVFARIAMSSA